MEEAYKKFMIQCERIAMRGMLEKIECPPEIMEFFDCMIRNGCPGKSVVLGIIEFGRYISEEKGEVDFTPDQFADLLKGTNIVIQEDEKDE